MPEVSFVFWSVSLTGVSLPDRNSLKYTAGFTMKSLIVIKISAKNSSIDLKKLLFAPVPEGDDLIGFNRVCADSDVFAVIVDPRFAVLLEIVDDDLVPNMAGMGAGVLSISTLGILDFAEERLLVAMVTGPPDSEPLSIMNRKR